MADKKNEFIGYARCDCGSDKAKLSLSDKSKLCYFTCAACQTQTFARSGRADEVLRKRLVSAAPPPPQEQREEGAAAVADDWDPYK